MIIAFALFVFVACVVASAHRVRLAVEATALDPQALVEALRGDAGRARYTRLRALLEGLPAESWERDLIAASAADASVRTALVNEQLTELDYRTQRWGRVPRVCASITASSSFLLATLVMREGLAVAADLPDDARTAAFDAVVRDAVGVAALGMAGAAYCIAIQYAARKIAQARLQATDKLVERLESLSA